MAASIRMGIVIPLANEETTIAELLDRLRRQIGPQDRVYTILDRVSKDRTREIVQRFHDQLDDRFVVVWAPENRCVVDAYVSGYRFAFAAGCEWILEMDGGFSHLPEEIPQFVEGMQQGHDFVGGSRFMPGGSHNSPWTRRCISKGGTVLANWLLRTRMTDMTSGFECFSRQAMHRILERGLASRANFFQTEIRFLMHDLSWREVPITYRNENYRIGRSSLREAFRILWALHRSQRKDHGTE